MRIISLILLIILGVGNLVSSHVTLSSPHWKFLNCFETVARRTPPIHVPGGLWNLAAFNSRPYTIYCCSGLVSFLGLYTGMDTTMLKFKANT
jgi:hypothetical protein